METFDHKDPEKLSLKTQPKRKIGWTSGRRKLNPDWKEGMIELITLTSIYRCVLRQAQCWRQGIPQGTKQAKFLAWSLSKKYSNLNVLKLHSLSRSDIFLIFSGFTVSSIWVSIWKEI